MHEIGILWDLPHNIIPLPCRMSIITIIMLLNDDSFAFTRSSSASTSFHVISCPLRNYRNINLYNLPFDAINFIKLRFRRTTSSSLLGHHYIHQLLITRSIEIIPRQIALHRGSSPVQPSLIATAVHVVSIGTTCSRENMGPWSLISPSCNFVQSRSTDSYLALDHHSETMIAVSISCIIISHYRSIDWSFVWIWCPLFAGGGN